MHINRLRLLGFKSFVEPTELVVERGLTGVVGPNGCGKSNLLEALRWVMGETSHKSMRAVAMDDVIFSGTTTRPARNTAEVTIFIDNSARQAPSEFNANDTLEVTRRIEREAGSAYRINGREVRARDVRILFEDAATGARSPALVRQGQIGELVNAKPEQRRRILEDAAGNFWMSCNRGIFRINRRDFDRYDRREIRAIPAVAYSRADGLRSPECNGGFQPAGWRSRDGRLWFPTIGGAAVVDPARLRVNTVAPPVALEALLVDGKPSPIGPEIRVPPGKRNLELHYTAPSFVAPERVAFRYRLDGLDPDWIEAGPRRVAYYTNLPSGRYTFRVTARNDSGIWAAQAASLAFVVEPRFYQTVWFLLLCAAAVGVAAEGAYVLRVHRLKARQKELESLVAERTRQLAEANQVLERLSLADPLTGTANRRQFERVLEFERRRSERTDAPLALLMIDIDEFKVLNDAFGHLVGDDCLKRVAQELSASVRGAGDLVARYGGEEFAVILAGTDEDGARILAERIRSRVESLSIPRDPARPGDRLTVSIGAAGVNRARGITAEALVAAADQALYRAKQSGRNRVEVGELRE